MPFLKRLFLTLCTLLTLVSTVAAQMVSVTEDKVNLRSTPSVNSPVLWEYGKGYPLQVISKKGNWYKVSDFENDVGWVYKKLVDRKPHMIVKKEIINIRSGPGSKYKLLGKANYGVVFKTLEQQSGWAKIQHQNGLVGWVRRDLVWGW